MKRQTGPPFQEALACAAIHEDAGTAPPVSTSMRTAVSSDGKIAPLHIFEREDCVMPMASANFACEIPLALRCEMSCSMPVKMPDRNITVKHVYAPQSLDLTGAAGHTQCMERLAQIREAKGLTQAQLAEMIGVNQGFISKIEKGQANPTLEKINAIAAALHVSAGELFGKTPLRDRAELALSLMDPAKEAVAVAALEAMAGRQEPKAED